MEGVIIKTEVKEEQFDFVEEEIVQEEEEEEEAEEEGVNNVDSAGGEEEEDRRKQYHQDDRGSSQGKIFVGGVSWDTTEESFTKHFEKYGEIIDSVIMKEKHTRRPRGFGFITFSDPLVLDKVLEDEHVINGRTVEVKRTVPREDMEVKGVQKTKKIFVGGIPPSVTEDELKEYFSSYGSIAEHQIMLDHGSGRSRGFGFVTFESENVVETIINEGKTHELGGKQVEIKKAEPKRGGGDYGTDPRDRHGGGYSGSYGYGGAAAYGYSGGSRSGGYGGRSAKGYGGYGRGYGAGAASSYDGYGGYRAGYGAPMYGNGEYGDDGYGSPGVYGGAGYYGAAGYGGGYGAAGYGGGYGAGGYGAGGGYGTGGYGNGYGAAAGAYGGGGSGSYGSGGNKGYGGGAPAGRGRYHPYGR